MTDNNDNDDSNHPAIRMYCTYADFTLIPHLFHAISLMIAIKSADNVLTVRRVGFGEKNGGRGTQQLMCLERRLTGSLGTYRLCVTLDGRWSTGVSRSAWDKAFCSS